MFSRLKESCTTQGNIEFGIDSRLTNSDNVSIFVKLNFRLFLRVTECNTRYSRTRLKSNGSITYRNKFTKSFERTE